MSRLSLFKLENFHFLPTPTEAIGMTQKSINQYAHFQYDNIKPTTNKNSYDLVIFGSQTIKIAYEHSYLFYS